ncbi:MAG: MFS transporter [Anaerolineae bacterium]|nr:MFS transporter [Anaerolineae bacterium]
MKAKLLPRPLLMFMSTMVLANIASRMYQPLMALYLQSLGADVKQVGLFFTLGSIAPLAFQILGGWLSDSLGRLQAVAIGSIAGIFGMAVYLAAPSWQWLLISTALAAMAGAFVSPSFQAIIAEQADEENLGKVYGLCESIFMIVGIVGPPLGGFLADQFGFKVMFMAATTLYGLATVIRLWMARNARKCAKASKSKPSFTALKTDMRTIIGMVLAGGVLTWILISDGVRDVTYRLAFEMESLYLQDVLGLTKTQIGWLISISSVTTALLMSGAGALSDRYGERVGIVGGFALVATGISVFLGSAGFLGCLVAWVLFGVGSALISPAYNALISKVTPKSLRGTAFGLFTTSFSIISLPAPYVGALLWNRFGPQAPFYLPIVATVILLPIMWVKFRLPGTDTQAAPQPAERQPAAPQPAESVQPA